MELTLTEMADLKFGNLKHHLTEQKRARGQARQPNLQRQSMPWRRTTPSNGRMQKWWTTIHGTAKDALSQPDTLGKSGTR